MDTLSPLWLVAIPIGLVVGFILGALILQAACALCNLEDLRFRKAVTLVLLLLVINVPVGLGIAFLAALLGDKIGMGKEVLWGGCLAVGIFLYCVVTGFILCLLLPIGFSKGILVALLQGIISLVLAGVVGGLALVVLAFMQLAA
jgi:hypothetical protein